MTKRPRCRRLCKRALTGCACFPRPYRSFSFPLFPLRSDEEYDAATDWLAPMIKLDLSADTLEGQRVLKVVHEVEDYERLRWPMTRWDRLRAWWHGF